MSAWLDADHKEEMESLNEYKSKLGDFTDFYIIIAICTVVLGLIIILNVVCCCSRYSSYWLDPHTGNRWIVSLWTMSPKQPPYDLSELEKGLSQKPYKREEFTNLELPSATSRQPLTSSEEYLELHKLESSL